MKTLFSALKNRNQHDVDFHEDAASQSNPFTGIRNRIKERSYRKNERKNARDEILVQFEGMNRLQRI